MQRSCCNRPVPKNVLLLNVSNGVADFFTAHPESDNCNADCIAHRSSNVGYPDKRPDK